MIKLDNIYSDSSSEFDEEKENERFWISMSG